MTAIKLAIACSHVFYILLLRGHITAYFFLTTNLLINVGLGIQDTLYNVSSSKWEWQNLGRAMVSGLLVKYNHIKAERVHYWEDSHCTGVISTSLHIHILDRVGNLRNVIYSVKRINRRLLFRLKWGPCYGFVYKWLGQENHKFLT